MNVGVVAHAGKSLEGGLAELRRVLAAEGISDPFWSEVPKSRYAPDQVRRALDHGAELVFAWGGDGMVQRCADVLAGTDASLAIVPAGTANLFATNLGIPRDIAQAVAVGLRGARSLFDVGRLNGERFVGDGWSGVRRGHDPGRRRRRSEGATRPSGLCLERVREPAF